jgi:hypothetical protein
MQIQHLHPIEKFDALLRDLVGWGLVERQEAATNTPWQLVPAAQRRLDELLSPIRVSGGEADVYLDHLCADCHRRGLTRRHGASYVCDRCWAQRQAQLDGVVTEGVHQGPGASRRPGP